MRVLFTFYRSYSRRHQSTPPCPPCFLLEIYSYKLSVVTKLRQHNTMLQGEAVKRADKYMGYDPTTMRRRAIVLNTTGTTHARQQPMGYDPPKERPF